MFKDAGQPKTREEVRVGPELFISYLLFPNGVTVVIEK